LDFLVVFYVHNSVFLCLLACVRTIFLGGCVEIRMLRQLFQEGLLLSASVVPAPMEHDRWLLVFEKANGNQERITKARSNIEKVYKRINGALVDAQEIGFKRVSVEFND
tara:strand:+ start:165 stop:491 length:327 start_codon:yes stop_codon:yes gene_type:complete